jgi:predicted dithiol-disulfide oxidoreductase (DUF899 family)
MVVGWPGQHRRPDAAEVTMRQAAGTNRGARHRPRQPVWHVLDLTPHGRGDWYPELAD